MNADAPITLVRQEYLQKIVEVTNENALPSVFKADVLEGILNQLRAFAESELKRDEEAYRAKQATSGQTKAPFTGKILIQAKEEDNQSTAKKEG